MYFSLEYTAKSVPFCVRKKKGVYNSTHSGHGKNQKNMKKERKKKCLTRQSEESKLGATSVARAKSQAESGDRACRSLLILL